MGSETLATPVINQLRIETSQAASDKTLAHPSESISAISLPNCYKLLHRCLNMSRGMTLIIERSYTSRNCRDSADRLRRYDFWRAKCIFPTTNREMISGDFRSATG